MLDCCCVYVADSVGDEAADEDGDAISEEPCGLPVRGLEWEPERTTVS